MEKNTVIQELHRLKGLWEKIVPITTQLVHLADDKATATDSREQTEKSQYHYNPNIKIPNVLPENHAAQVNAKIAERHKADCLKAAQKKLRKTGVALTVAMLIGVVIMLATHVMNFMSGNLETYNFFGKFGALGEFFLQLVFVRFADQEGNLSNMGLVYGVMAAFTVFIQLVEVFVVRAAAATSLRAKAATKVPALGMPMKGLMIAAAVVLGVFSGFTWLTVNPLGVLSLVPVLVLNPILKIGVGKLQDARHPVPLAEEVVALEAARTQDNQNKAANEAARKEANAKAKRKFDANKKKELAELDETLAQCNQEIEVATDHVAALKKEVQSQVISAKDNNLNTIVRLLDYLENGRADTLKEALHMVDMDKQRELDRENERMIAQMKMQNDRFMAQLDREAAQRNADRLLEDQRWHNERVREAQDRHNSQMEREQYQHNRDVMRELERINKG